MCDECDTCIECGSPMCNACGECSEYDCECNDFELGAACDLNDTECESCQ